LFGDSLKEKKEFEFRIITFFLVEFQRIIGYLSFVEGNSNKNPLFNF